jgi:predicted ATPase/DNA-binding XRE family transcriptional regulator
MQPDERVEFGALLRHYRGAAALSQEALAERAGLSRRGIADLERGARSFPYGETVRRLADALGLDPAARAALLAAGQRPAMAAGTRSTELTNVPARRTALIGREGDVVALRQLVLEAPGRLVSLIGTGGCGKTQLVLRLAEDLLEHFPDGVWFVDLAALQEQELIPNAVAAVLNRHEHPGQTLTDTILAYLRSRRLLLVLDNCEHLIEAVADLVERVLTRCSRVRLLTTSRERLRVPGEVTWRVASLRSPDPRATLAPAELLEYSAAQLFVDRATAAQPSFAVKPDNVEAIARICRRLEGLPLAVELAAARAQVLAPAQILDRLDHSFGLLVGGGRTAPSRQQTMRATLDWSYRLLTPMERLVFGRLAVFAADFSLEAAEAVCAEGAVSSSDLLDLLGRLVDKSLLLTARRSRNQRAAFLPP